MSSSSRELAEFYAELIAPIGGVEVKRMFSGAGLCVGEFQFGMVVRDTFYFRVDDETRPVYVERGSEPFTYSRKDGREVTVARYYSVPDDVAENREALCGLALQSLETAKRDDVRRESTKKRARGAD